MSNHKIEKATKTREMFFVYFALYVALVEWILSSLLFIFVYIIKNFNNN